MPSLYWENGLIKMPFRVWKSPTNRRIPRLLIEPRLREVVIKFFLEKDKFIFQETTTPSNNIKDVRNKYPLEKYKDRYLIPTMVGKWDFLDYIRYYPIYFFAFDNRFYYICEELGGDPKELPEDWYKKHE